MQQLLRIENILFIFRGFIVAFFFFIQSGESILEEPRLKFTLWHLQYNSWTESKIKSLPFMDVSKFSWYIQQSHLKSLDVISITSFALV